MRRIGFDPDPELVRLSRVPVSPLELDLPALSGSGRAWLVTRHAEVRAVLGDPELFSSAALGAGQWPRPAGASPSAPSPTPLIGDDPPVHTRLRRILMPEFTGTRMRRLRPRIEKIVAEHLDAMRRSGPPADLVRAFAAPIPSLVICELLGVPYADRADFQRRSQERLDMSSAADRRRAAAAESRQYMTELIARHRAQPADGLLGTLVTRHGSEFTDDQLAGLGDVLLHAGHETTANVLGAGAALLLCQPSQLATVRDCPAALDGAVEELLRHLSVVHSTVRRAVADVELGGQLVRAGDVVVCSLLMGNRDAAFGGDLDRLDVTRGPVPHLAFGHGIHHCLGAMLARTEIRIALSALSRCFPTLRLAVPPHEITFRPSSVVYGVQSLPVVW
jgi:cytochrome P450